MSNIFRHSYVRFTGEPYISKFGVDVGPTDYYSPQPECLDRTVVRTNLPNGQIIYRVRANGMGHVMPPNGCQIR